MGRAKGRHSVHQRRAEPDGRYSRAERAVAQDECADLRQGLQDRADDDQERAGAGVQDAHAGRGRLVLDQHPGQPRRRSAGRSGVLQDQGRVEAGRCWSIILQPELYPDLYKDIFHKVRINYYPPRGDNKEGWDNIDIFGWLGYPMQLKVDFLCRDSILAAPLALDLCLFMDLAARTPSLRGLGIQEWLSFYFKAPDSAPGRVPGARSVYPVDEAEEHAAAHYGRGFDHAPRAGVLRRVGLFEDQRGPAIDWLRGFVVCGRNECRSQIRLRELIFNDRLFGFTESLMARRASWARKLVFACGEGCSATGLSAAVSIAGGTSLIVDSDSAVVKSVMRQGGLDFVVNTLDEALRVLKNEVRQGRPLSVGLIADVISTIREMVERGVLPDLHVVIQNGESAGYELEGLYQVGMEKLELARDGSGSADPSTILAQWLMERGWFEVLFQRNPEISSVVADGPLLDMLSPDDLLRRNWIQQISRYLRGAKGSRLVWLSGTEQRSFVDGTWRKSVV